MTCPIDCYIYIIKNILDFKGTGDYEEYYLTAEFTLECGGLCSCGAQYILIIVP